MYECSPLFILDECFMVAILDGFTVPLNDKHRAISKFVEQIVFKVQFSISRVKMRSYSLPQNPDSFQPYCVKNKNKSG